VIASTMSSLPGGRDHLDRLRGRSTTTTTPTPSRQSR